MLSSLLFKRCYSFFGLEGITWLIFKFSMDFIVLFALESFCRLDTSVLYRFWMLNMFLNIRKILLLWIIIMTTVLVQHIWSLWQQKQEESFTLIQNNLFPRIKFNNALPNSNQKSLRLHLIRIIYFAIIEIWGKDKAYKD